MVGMSPCEDPHGTSTSVAIWITVKQPSYVPSRMSSEKLCPMTEFYSTHRRSMSNRHKSMRIMKAFASNLQAIWARLGSPCKLILAFRMSLPHVRTCAVSDFIGQYKNTAVEKLSKKSMVSEKFHAMIRHAQLNSRFKDYYDLWLIANNFEFEARSLQKAIEKTFAKRQTEIPIERPIGLTPNLPKQTTPGGPSSWTSPIFKARKWKIL